MCMCVCTTVSLSVVGMRASISATVHVCVRLCVCAGRRACALALIKPISMATLMAVTGRQRRICLIYRC